MALSHSRFQPPAMPEVAYSGTKRWRFTASLRVVHPNPTQHVGQDGAAVIVRVRAFAPDVRDLVTRAVQLALIGRAIRIVECSEHLLVREKPTAELVVDVVRTVLQEDADRLGRSAADQRRIQVATRNHRLAIARRAVADGGVAADATDDLAKRIWPFPRHRERANRPAACAAN